MLKLSRIYQDDCTIGLLRFNGFRAVTLELPRLDNKQNISCIPAGLYECKKHNSPANGKCIAILNVVGRSHIQIHIANYLHDILGCVAIGDSLRQRDNGELMVTNSTKTMNELLSLLPDEFLLEIK